YTRLSTEREGVQYANWLSTLGVTSFVLKYRMAEFGHPAPLQDALRAVRMVRSRAAEFGINPARVGVLGSSAGGHLAASAGTLFDHPLVPTGAALDAASARPDFLMLLYPGQT
ncbi:MAG: alpha/beta hydrolase, partial [Massilia sp.]|nr:alpha/beta hydrolase [Massilia sp.]